MIRFGECSTGERTVYFTWSIPQCEGVGNSGDTGTTDDQTYTGRAQGPWFFKVLRTPGEWSGTEPPAGVTTAPAALEMQDQFSTLWSWAWPCTSQVPPEPWDWDGGCSAFDLYGGRGCWDGTYGPCENPGFSTYSFQLTIDYVIEPAGLYGYHPYQVEVWGAMEPFAPPP